MGFHVLSWYSPMYQAAESHPGVDVPGDAKRENYEAAPKAYGPEHTPHKAALILGGGEYTYPKIPSIMQGYIYYVLFGPNCLFANNSSPQSHGQHSGKSNEVENHKLFAPATEPIAKLLCAEVVEIASSTDAHLLGELARRTGFPSKDFRAQKSI